MLKWALVLAVVALVAAVLIGSGASIGPSQAPAILAYLLIAAIVLAILARLFVFKRMKNGPPDRRP